MPPDLTFEEAAFSRGVARVCGVDEAGRGPLAGPVVAAAVVLGPDIPSGLDDSKKLTPEARERSFAAVLRSCDVTWASASAATVDRLNVRAASLDAMRRAIGAFADPPDFALIDGNALPPHMPCEADALVGGDARSLSIAAASIVAKVVRDRMMVRADAFWPVYGLDGHKGYGVPTHRRAIEAHGGSPLHRRSFAPLKHL